MATRNAKKNKKSNKTSSSPPVYYGNAARNFKQGVGSPNAKTKDQQPSDQAQPLALALYEEEDPQIRTRSTVKNKPNKQLPPPPERKENMEENEEQMEITEEDDRLLETNTNEYKALLAGRKKYKKLQSQLARVSSHADECSQEGITPKGLRVNVKCNALLPDYSNVRQRFKQTSTQAEGEFKTSLEVHYSTAKDRLEREVEELKETLTTVLSTASTSEREEHSQMMATTDNNISKEMEKLRETKVKKMEFLQNPDRARPQNRGRGRGRGRGWGRPPYQTRKPNPPTEKEDMRREFQAWPVNDQA